MSNVNNCSPKLSMRLEFWMRHWHVYFAKYWNGLFILICCTKLKIFNQLYFAYCFLLNPLNPGGFGPNVTKIRTAITESEKSTSFLEYSISAILVIYLCKDLGEGSSLKIRVYIFPVEEDNFIFMLFEHHLRKKYCGKLKWDLIT